MNKLLDEEFINEENKKLSKRIIHSSQVLQERIGKPLGKLVYMDFTIFLTEVPIFEQVMFLK